MKTLLLLTALFLPLALVAGPSVEIRPGDANADGQVCMDDAIVIIYHLYRDGRPIPCMDAPDSARSGYIDTADCFMILRSIFHGDYIPDCPISCGESENDDESYYE